MKKYLLSVEITKRAHYFTVKSSVPRRSAYTVSLFPRGVPLLPVSCSEHTLTIGVYHYKKTKSIYKERKK